MTELEVEGSVGSGVAGGGGSHGVERVEDVAKVEASKEIEVEGSSVAA